MATNSFNSTIAPPPLNDVFVDKNRFASSQFANWLLLDLLPRVGAAPQAKQSTVLTAQAASVGVTALVPVANKGFYRINWYLQVTKVDSTGLTLTFNNQFTAFGRSLTESGAALAGNTLNTFQGGSFDIYADGASVISFSVTAGFGTGDGQFAAIVNAEFLG